MKTSQNKRNKMLKISQPKISITICQTTPKDRITFHGRNGKLEDVVIISEKITDHSKGAKPALKGNNPKITTMILGLASAFSLMGVLWRRNSSASVGTDKTPRPVISTETVKKINELEGSLDYRIEQIKKMLLKEMGFPANFVQIKSIVTEKNNEIAGFCSVTGIITVQKEDFEKMSNAKIASVLRHELDHMEKAVKICKSMGISPFKELLIQSFGETFAAETSMFFNKKFYKKAMKSVDITDFDFDLYHNALNEHFQPTLSDFSDYADFYNYAKYKNNAMEKSAFSVQREVEKAFGIEKKDIDFLIDKFFELDSKLDKCVELNSRFKIDKSMIFDYLLVQAIIESDYDVKIAHAKTRNNPDNETFKNEYIKLIVRKQNSLRFNGSDNDPDLMVKVFDKMGEMSQKTFTQAELQEIFIQRYSQLKVYSENGHAEEAGKLLAELFANGSQLF